MTPDEVARHAESLPQVRRTGTEALLEAYLDRADPRTVRAAIDLAWEMQRR